MKPTAILRNWYVWGNTLFGNVYQHPLSSWFNEHLHDGHRVQTSTILKDNGLTVETENTVYVLD